MRQEKRQLTRLCASAAAAIFMVALAYDKQILWQDQEHSNPIFIPESVLQETPLADLPMTKEERGSLRFAIDLFRSPPSPYPFTRSGEFPECMHISESNRAYPPGPDAVPLDVFIRQHEEVFVGEVVASIPGWGFSRSVITAIHVKVTSIVQNETQQLRQGQVLFFTLGGGVLDLHGARICYQGHGDFYRPQAGDRILVSGYVASRNPHHFWAYTFFELKDGMVMPQPYSSLKTRSPQPLSKILNNPWSANR